MFLEQAFNVANDFLSPNMVSQLYAVSKKVQKYIHTCIHTVVMNYRMGLETRPTSGLMFIHSQTDFHQSRDRLAQSQLFT